MLKPQGKVVIIDTLPPVPRQSPLLGANSVLLGAKAPHSPTLKSAASSTGQRSFKRSVGFALGALGAQPSPLSPRHVLKRSVSFAADVGNSDRECDQDQGDANMHATAADKVQDGFVRHQCPPEEQATAQPLLSGGVQSAPCWDSCGYSRARQGQTPMVVVNPPLTPEFPLEGLRFLTTGQETLEASEALHALAEGQSQCAVTGEALEHLLQHHDLSVLEIVMRNVVVFSRMKPHQKGQVMDLLGMAGIHQMYQGQPRYIPVGSSCCFQNVVACLALAHQFVAHAVSSGCLSCSCTLISYVTRCMCLSCSRPSCLAWPLECACTGVMSFHSSDYSVTYAALVLPQHSRCASVLSAPQQHHPCTHLCRAAIP